MKRVYRTAARIVLLLHLLFTVAAMFGGFAVLVSRAYLWIHLPVLFWAAAVNLFGWVCPLTPLEKSLLRAGGREHYEGGFLVHYFGPLLDLEKASRKIEIRTGVVILAWNGLVYSVIWAWS